MQDVQIADQIAKREIAGHEIARHDKYRMKIDCITIQFAFRLNFNFFCMQGKCVQVENFTASAHQQCSLICIMHCTVEFFAAATNLNRFVVISAHQHRW